MNPAAPVRALSSRRGLAGLDPLWICIGLPLLTWGVAYAQMALKYGDMWLFDNIVHENGVLTLTGTILYFNHFLRELPMELLWSVFALGVFMAWGPLRPVRFGESSRRTGIVGVCIVLGLFLLLVVAGSIRDVGLRGTIMDFLQGRNRTSETEMYHGSHWRNHLLSNIASMGWFVVLVWGYRRFWCDGRYRASAAGRRLVLVSVGGFILLTLLFGINSDPFASARYLGHQFREIPGNRIPLSSFILLGTLIILERRGQRRGESPATEGDRLRPGWLWGGVILTAIPTLFLALRILTLGDIGTEIARNDFTADWSAIDVFAWHYFEHVLDFVFLILVTTLLYLAVHPEQRKGRLG